jgi:predicted transcriptional regulator
MNITRKAISGYRIKMQNCINDQVGQGNATITQDDLAACMNVKISTAFRRHISEMQDEGLVTRFTYQTERGGYKVAYVIGGYSAKKNEVYVDNIPF